MTILPRTLWFEDSDERRTLSQSELLGRPECVVVLGEAGMGKTELMLWLGTQPAYTYVTARKLKNSRGPATPAKDGASAFAIDALDELSTDRKSVV